MDARIIPQQVAEEKDNDKETLSMLIDLMGNIDGGANTKEFQEIKQQMMNSGITTEGLLDLLGNSFTEAIISRKVMNVPIQFLTETAQCPTYSHTSDACADIYSDEEVTIQPGETHLVSTGIALAIPQGFDCHLYARSGLSSKTGFRLANSVGIIDAGYRDELKVPVWNAGKEPLLIEKGMRIAQMDIKESPAMDFIEVEDVKTIKGDRLGGFGSSGLFDKPEDEEVNGEV